MNNAARDNLPLLSIAFISALALSYETLLTRLFAIIQWHHFAYMIISFALLGYGVSGTFLSLFRQALLKRYKTAFIINTILFSISLLICFLLAQHIPFNAQEILWDRQQIGWLFAIYLLLMIPFFFVANAIALIMMAKGESISRIYAADMVGAGAGSALIILLLFYVMPGHLLQVLSVLAVATTVIACLELRYKQRLVFIVSGTLLLAVSLLPTQWTNLELSPYKSLPQLLRIDGTRIVETRSSPLGLINVVASTITPLRYAPGLSLQATTEPPSQLAVFTDADNMTVINKVNDNAKTPEYLQYQTSAAPYQLRDANRVLILGAGTGNDILQAAGYKIDTIDAVELNPQMVALVKNDHAEYAGHLYQRPNVHVHIAEARGFVSRSKQPYDVIQIALLDTFGASSAGLYALNENYLYTVEAFKEYISHLKANGVLSITRWVKLPPRDNLKMFATAVTALRQLGYHEPEKQLILVRSWQTATLLVKPSAFSHQDIENIQRFCEKLGFDTAYFPGIKASQTNRFNQLRVPYFYNAAIALLGNNANTFYDQYKFNITPATDNRPYFFNFFKWKLLNDILKLKDQGGMPLVEWGYIIMIAALVQAVIASTLLIVFPLLLKKETRLPVDKTTLLCLLYFGSLGLAFLFIEIAFMQKFILFLHHPVYSIAVTLTAFLVFAGVGSHYSGYLRGKFGYRFTVKLAVAFIVALGSLYSVALHTLFEWLLPFSTAAKITVTIIAIAPLALFMGMPFPLALHYLSEKSPALVPWVWGVNGCASVISAVLAMVLAVHFGFNVVILIALLLYVAAVLLFLRLRSVVNVASFSTLNGFH
ncbi:MAG: SAM-dependent methyltransferase [Gammaproteobacteria bacterium]|jgi:hypothetical protein